MNQTTMDLVGDREIVIARTFDAPARIVFDAWTRPELVRRWWAPKSHRVTVASCEADVRAGGSYRYVLHHEGGPDLGFAGAYREVTPHTRLVYTQVFDGQPGAEVVVTVSFAEHGGRTSLVAREIYPSAEVRAAVLATGMEHGMRETLEQLDALVSEMAR
jgi:uncharacterized protein YndB with AHSA1/START domain